MKQTNIVALMVLAAACWGLGTVISKAVLDQVPPLTLLVIQLAVSTSFLWLIFLIRRPPISLGKEFIRLSLAGLLNPGVAYTLGLIGLAMTSASMSALIWAAEPALILGLAWIVLRERPANLTLLLSMIATAGALLIIGGGAGLNGSGMLFGNLLIAGAVFCCAIYTVLSRQSVEKVNPISLVAVQQTVSLAWALLIWPLEITGGGAAGLLANLQPATWFWAAASGLIYYGMAFLFYITGLKRMPAVEAGLYLNLIPIFGVAGAFLFLGERLTPAQWAGAATILLAVFAISLLQKKGKVLRDSPVANSRSPVGPASYSAPDEA